MRVFIPLSEDRKYFVYAELPEPVDFDGDGYYFRIGKWYIRYERGSGTFEIQGVKSIKLRRLRALLKKEIEMEKKPWCWP